jgi:hypothetical protein
LFSAMPPWEAVKTLLSLLVTDGVDDASFDDEELEMAIFDISRAHFMPKCKRELYIELPPEDRDFNDGDLVGRLNRNMYGFRDAANGWSEDWQRTLSEVGFAVGVANPALFHRSSDNTRGAVHGDDFYVLGRRGPLNEVAAALGQKYSLRESFRIGFGEHCAREAMVLNRVVTLGRGTDGRKFVCIEPDSRHIEIMLQTVGLDPQGTKPVATPSLKPTDADASRRATAPELSRARTTQYRSCVMRGSFLAQERSDIGEAIKTLAQGMAKPNEQHWEDLKRCCRYLVGKPNLALFYKQQIMPKTVKASVDSDYAADRLTRKSTTGMVVRLGAHVVKTSSNLQSSIGLNVSECEFYALVHGAAHCLGMQAFLRDLGLRLDIVLESDSNAAGAFCSRKGLGKQRHVETRFLWIQDRVAAGHLRIVKIPGDRNVSDILTKSTTSVILAKHAATMGLQIAKRSRLQKKAG